MIYNCIMFTFCSRCVLLYVTLGGDVIFGCKFATCIIKFGGVAVWSCKM